MTHADFETFDLVVLGSGPAGQKAAIEAANAGASVLLVEQERSVGGACVHRGTIPSKTLRETALSLQAFRRRTGSVFEVHTPADLQVVSLMTRMEQVVKAHERFMGAQVDRSRVVAWHGRASFSGTHEIEVLTVRGERRRARASAFVIATGSRPRAPKEIPIDHEHVLDSDSILSMVYLPASLTVLGAGVIASEYATIFAALGVRVTMIDKGERPVAFLDEELTDRFLVEFGKMGGTFLGRARVKGVEWDGVSSVRTTLEDGSVVESEKLLCALGREANLETLRIDRAGLATTERGLLSVDDDCRTAVPHVFAAGDVIGPPSLASTSMEQGRRAARAALGLASHAGRETIPMGIYTVPEMSSVGLTEKEAVRRFGGVVVGRAPFEELARGQIAAIESGMLKLVADPSGRRLVGVHIVGEGAAELIHVGQMALVYKSDVDAFVDNIFNFPTLAEAYRVAALEILAKRPVPSPAVPLVHSSF